MQLFLTEVTSKMASNEYVIPGHYEDLTPAPQLDQKTLNKMAWRSCFLQASFNYERMQAAGWLYSIIPGLEKIHTNKNDLAASMSHNLEFFNTHPFLVTFVMGIVLSLEQNKVDIPTIRAVRVAAMGPLGGIGDALFWLTLVPITAGITSNMAINGNAAAPIIFLVIFNAVQFALRFWLMNWSYKLGTSAIDALTANMQAFTRAASIMGVFVVGCLVVTMGGTQINLQIPNGTTRGIAAHTVVVSEEEAENFTGLEGIDTETAEAGTMAMTDADGNALTATDADGKVNQVSIPGPVEPEEPVIPEESSSSSGGGSATLSAPASPLPGLTVTDKDGQRISYTSTQSGNTLTVCVGRFTASLHASLSALRQLRAEGIETITFQTILCSTTLSLDELLAMGGEDAEVVLTHHIRSSTLTVGGKAV